METVKYIESEATRGVALVIHGLNLKPSGMNELATFLVHQKFDVCRISLSGHAEQVTNRKKRLAPFQDVSLTTWRNEVQTAYKYAINIAAQKEVPLLLIGFSLGGALGVDLTSGLGHQAFHRQILFSPALAVKPMSRLLKPLHGFPRLVIPSISPGEYRVNYGTPMAGYTALFELIADLENNTNSMHNSETLVFIDACDELVSVSGLENYIARNNLSRWSLHKIKKTSDKCTWFKHLTIDRKTLGQTNWNSITCEIKAFLDRSFTP